MAYTPTTWNTGDVITKDKLNKLENGVAAIGDGMTGTITAVELIATPESADAATIATKVNEIITQLKSRGIVS